MSKNRNFSKLVASVDNTGKVSNSGAISQDGVRTVESYDSAASLPTSGLQNGDRALAGNKLFISNGSGWYNFSLINLNPSIDSGPDGAAYDLDSTNTVSISLVASDSDGTPIIWSFTTSDSATELATITNDSDGSFNVTGKSLADILAAGYDSDGGSFTVTFRASDGISFDADSASFTLTYNVSAPTKQTWTINGMSFSLASGLLDTTTDQNQPFDAYVSPDGSNLYVCGTSPNGVQQYSLSTPNDVSTATYVDEKTTSEVALGIYFKPDGTKMYTVGYTDDAAREYILSTPWDVTSASLNHSKTSLQNTNNPSGVWFNFEGTIMMVSFDNSHSISKFTLSTAWDLSTATLAETVAFSSTIYPQGLIFEPGGLYALFADSYNNRIYRMTMTTPFVLTTSIANVISITQDTVLVGLGHAWDGTKIYPVTRGNDRVYQWNTGL